MVNKKLQGRKAEAGFFQRKKAQEEMVGFALIMIIVSIILLVFLGFSLNSPNKENVESYEAESFMTSYVQYTSDCRNNFEPQEIYDVIVSCSQEETCADGRYACDVLETLSEEILNKSWKIGENYPVRGYSLNITNEGESILSIEEGNETSNSKGHLESLPRGIDIVFRAYY